MEADGPKCTDLFKVRSAYTDAVGDLGLIDEKYGPSIGLTQVRSLRNPHAWGVADRWRVARLLQNPDFNAEAAWWISKGGTDFTPWTMFRNGMWKPHAGLDFEIKTGHPRAGEWSK
jgi:coproporphyrinogen III oxidase